MYNKDDISKLPKKSAIYFLFSKRKKLVYIGKTFDLRNRMRLHLKNLQWFEEVIKNYYGSRTTDAKPFEYFRYSILNEEQVVNINKIENNLIINLRPRYNDRTIYYKNKLMEQNMDKLMFRQYYKND